MLLPAAVIRLLRPGTRESLDGFVIGALGALVFTAAATLVRLGPQFSTGLFARVRPLRGLIAEMVMSGVTLPVTAAAAGGLFGVLLWFTPAGHHDRRVRLLLGMLAALVLLGHTAVGAVEIAGLTQLTMLAIHLTAAALAVVALRVALQLALLHESPTQSARISPLCTHCEMVVPDMTFCPACGAATRASTHLPPGTPQHPTATRRAGPAGGLRDQLSGLRAARRDIPRPGADPPPIRVAGRTVRNHGGRTGRGARRDDPGSHAEIAHYMCPPECGHPGRDPGDRAAPLHLTGRGVLGVLPTPESAYEVTLYDNGVTARFIGGDTGTMQLFSQPAGGRSARDIVESILRKRFPDSRVSYEIPNAMVGYEPGYGVLADDWPNNPPHPSPGSGFW